MRKIFFPAFFAALVCSFSAWAGVATPPVPTPVPINLGGNGSAYGPFPFVTQSDDYSILSSDCGKTIRMNKATAQILTVSLNATHAISTNCIIRIVQSGVGLLSVHPESASVLINGASSDYTVSAQYGLVVLQKESTNSWALSGDYNVNAPANSLYGNTATGSASPSFTTAPVLAGTLTAADFAVPSGSPGLFKPRAAYTGRGFIAGTPGALPSLTNATPQTLDRMYCVSNYNFAPTPITEIGIRTSSTNASVGAVFKGCAYASDPITGVVTGHPIGTTSEIAIGDLAASTVVTGTMIATLPMGQNYLCIIPQASTTGARFSVYASLGLATVNGASSLSQAFSQNQYFAYYKDVTYADGCPTSPSMTGAVTFGNQPAIGYTVQ